MASNQNASPKTKQFIAKAHSSDQQGFALPLVVIIGMFLMIGGFAMLARTFSTFQGSIKNNQQQQAQELAEEGVSKIIDQLNSQYRYLWVNCHNSTDGACSQSNVGGWNNSANDYGGNKPIINVASCLDIETNPPHKRNTSNYSDGLILNEDIDAGVTEGKQAKRGIWTLESYTFEGNPWMGGRGVIRVRGDRTRTNSHNSSSASAIIDHHVEVKAKPCERRLTERFSEGTFPGLLADTVDLGNNDVVGDPSANVYCTTCLDKTDIGRKTGSVVDGDLFAGAINLPPVPLFPESLRQYVSPGDLYLSGQQELTIGPAKKALTSFNPVGDNFNFNHPGPNPMCVTDENMVTHCLVNDINLTGKGNVKVDTGKDPSSGKGTLPVRIYLEGNIKSNGKPTIENTANSTSLSIFGTSSCTTTPTQKITLGGGAQTKAFIYAPCAEVGINGGSSRATCQEPGKTKKSFDNKSPNPDGTECEDGDFEGAIWAKEWGLSQAQGGEITVPAHLEADLVTIFGEQFSVGPSDFVGVGVPRWTSYQEPQ